MKQLTDNYANGSAFVDTNYIKYLKCHWNSQAGLLFINKERRYKACGSPLPLPQLNKKKKEKKTLKKTKLYFSDAGCHDIDEKCNSLVILESDTFYTYSLICSESILCISKSSSPSLLSKPLSRSLKITYKTIYLTVEWPLSPQRAIHHYIVRILWWSN